MARDPTTFSRVSTGYKDSANTIGESGYDLGFLDAVGTTLTLGGGTKLTNLSITTHSADWGSVAQYGYSTITVGITGVADGDLLLAMYPSLFSGTYNALSVYATSGDTTGEANLIAINSGATAVDPAAAVVNVLRVTF